MGVTPLLRRSPCAPSPRRAARCVADWPCAISACDATARDSCIWAACVATAWDAETWTTARAARVATAWAAWRDGRAGRMGSGRENFSERDVVADRDERGRAGRGSDVVTGRGDRGRGGRGREGGGMGGRDARWMAARRRESVGVCTSSRRWCGSNRRARTAGPRARQTCGVASIARSDPRREPAPGAALLGEHSRSLRRGARALSSPHVARPRPPLLLGARRTRRLAAPDPRRCSGVRLRPRDARARRGRRSGTARVSTARAVVVRAFGRRGAPGLRQPCLTHLR